MIHAETCRLGTVRLAELRQAITAHLEALRAEDKQVHRMMLELVRQRPDLRRDQRLLKTIKGIGVKSALGLLASVPNSAGSTTRRQPHSSVLLHSSAKAAP